MQLMDGIMTNRLETLLKPVYSREKAIDLICLL
jgi:hypothetical protein